VTRYKSIVAAAAGFLIACGPKPTPAWHQEQGYRWRDVNVDGGDPGFTSMKRTGIDFQNFVSDSALLGNRILGQGAGVAIGDVDGDGLPDVFLARTEGCSALYRNLGNWKFEDITKRAGVGACDRHSTGVALADVDGDGDLDLVLVATRGPNAIFINDGKGHFTEHRDLGFDPKGKGGTTVTLADIDGSGRLAMYVSNYNWYHLDDSIPPQERAFNQMVREVSKGKYEIVPERRGDYKLVNRPDMGGLRMSMRGAPNDFYLNDGTGHFTRVSMASDRFIDTTGKPLTEEPESFSLDAKFVDVNGDGFPDLYVTNDFEDQDQLWINDGHGRFHLAPWTVQRQTSNSSMGMDVADVNGDGLPDMFIDDMLANDSKRIKTQMPTHTALPKKPGDIETQLQQQRNTLFINRGDGTFSEVGMLAGVQASGWSWGSMFMDVDLDGRQDILVAAGHLWDIMDADVQEGLQNRLTGFPWQRLRWQFPALKLHNVAYRNRGDLTFEDVSAKWGFAGDEAVSHAMAAGDLDGDGDLDVIVNRLGSPALVLRNNASAARIGVRLIGAAPNTHAVGAKIRLLNGATPLQAHEVVAGGLYMSHSDYQASFAMGKSDSATLEIDWRDGRQTRIMGVKPNRMYEITETTSDAALAPAAERAAPQPTLFEDVTPMLGGHTHVDPAYDDWERQFLLPNSLSQLGPGVSFFDYDRDGHEDLLIGTGRGGRIGVFHNQNGKLVPQPAQGPVAAADYTTLLGIPGDGATPTRIVAGVSAWEGQIVPPAVTIGVGRGGLASVADAISDPRLTAVGPMALGDYDGDGALDLFVGGRAFAGKYPQPVSSNLYRNVHGKFVLDSANAGVLKDIGMVSSAMFADIDGDGHPDLVLAREWDSILLLLNRNGKFVAAPESWGLSKLTSRWIGIAAGDLDGDGRLDLVATSWGRNTAIPVDSTNPLVLVYGPFGSGTEQEMLLARNDPRTNKLMPLNSYPRVRSVIRDLSTRISTFAAYADASVDSILGPARSVVSRKSVVTMDHVVLMNRGDHFEVKPLPMEAQFAPASYAGIADFDGDGFEDVFLSENFFPTMVGMPRYDAGRGLLLTGDGKGNLQPMPGTKSGIIVYGDQRGAAYADYDGDGRLDLAVSQNAAATRLFHNRLAKPGLRVRVQGPPGNPDAIGAQVRIVYGDRMGPVREIQAGSGYWSQNGAVQVFGLSGTPTAVWVRWPGGGETKTPVSAGMNELSVRRQ
jgi:enediyne biosynthesis protein E4